MPQRGAVGANSSSPPATPIARLWQTSHAPEYFGVIVLFVSWICLALFVTPFHRLFTVDDLRISYPHAEYERVPVFMAFVYALFVPLGILVAYNFIMRSSPAKHEATYLPFMISIVLTMFLTDIVKNAVGRPRPDLLDRCQPAPGTKPHTLVDIGVCTSADGHKLQDGWRSFPSGHSSFAFSGLGFLSLFFSGQFHIYRTATGGRDLSRALLCLAPLIGAAMIAISRCEDYRHDVYDVCVGSLLGMAVAYWSYRRHWPALRSSFCDQPYPRPGADGQVWQRIRDEEEAADETYELGSMSGNGRSQDAT